jgi:hypothetical protein
MKTDRVKADLERIKTILDRFGSAYFFILGEANVSNLMRGISTLLDKPQHLVHLKSARPGFRGVLNIKTELQAGHTIILGCTQSSGFAQNLFTSLPSFQKLAPGESISFSNRIALGPAQQPLGGVIVIHHCDGSTQSELDYDLCEKPNYIAIYDRETIAALEDRGSALTNPISSAGMTLSIRDLCFLHERDDRSAHDGQGSSPLVEIDAILNKPSPILWAELKSLMMAPLDLSLPTKLFNESRLTREQFDCYMDADELLKRAQGDRERVAGHEIYANVYDALWAIESSKVRYQFYRGQRNAEWSLEPSLFRPDAAKHSPDIETLTRLLSKTSAFLKEVRGSFEKYLGGSTDDESLLAIAQHFGMPTHLLDFSRSPRVAAFFATGGDVPSFAPTEQMIGQIYCLRADDSDVLFDAGGANRSERTYNTTQSSIALGSLGGALGLAIEGLAGIHFGNLKVIEPKLPPKEDRIQRQLGVFIEKFDAVHLLKARMKIFCFRQRPGIRFEDTGAGIDRATLLPDDTGLAQLADSIRNAWSSESKPNSETSNSPAIANIALDPALAPLVISRPTIVGSMGAALGVQVERGETFLRTLASYLEKAGPKDWISEIKGIFLRYFEDCSTHARLGEQNPTRQTLDGFDGRVFISAALSDAIKRLAQWAEVNPTLLANSLLPELDGPPSIFSDEPNPRRTPTLIATEPRHRIVLACGCYLAAWEHLRHVGGMRARDLTMKATRLLGDE